MSLTALSVARSRPPQRHALVLGAGVVGLTSAWALHHAGWRVTVLDHSGPGAGASGANGAQLSYAYVQPLADPAIWRQLPKLLLDADSPLKLRPQLDTAQWAWCAQFMAACRSSVSARSTAALLALAAESRAAWAKLWPLIGAACDHSATGKLVLYPDAAGLAAGERQLALQRALGCEQRALPMSDCVALEPALADSAQRWAGGIHTPSECAVDAAAVCQALHHHLAAQGVDFVWGYAAERLHMRSGRVVGVQAGTAELQADAVVMALGSGSATLARTHGWHLPVYPLKGYSITLGLAGQTEAAPRVNITDLGRKVVFARLGERLRVAGMVEIVGHDRGIAPARIRSLLASTERAFPRLALPPAQEVQPWCGLRPATPTGLPITGRRSGAPANLWFNTGHGALGLTLAMGSAQRLVRQMDLAV